MAKRERLRLSHTNPDLAVSKAEQVTDDDERAQTVLDVARNIEGTHPEQAAQLIAQTQTASHAGKAQMQLNVLSARAFVAAAQNQQQEFRTLLQRGFELAKQLVSESQASGEMQFVRGLASLVQIAAQKYPDLTAVFLQSLSTSRLKAELLLSAAAALQMPARLPLGSPAQKPATSVVTSWPGR